MSSFLFRSLWARKRRVVSSGIAVIIGIAFLTSTMLLGNAMTTGIDELFTEGYSGVDVEVRGAESISAGERDVVAPIDESLVDELGALPDVERALPDVEGIAQIVGSDGDPIGGNGPPTIGDNWVDDPRNPYVLVDGRAPTRAGEVVVDRDAADQGDLAVGDTTTVRVPEPVDVRVVGIAQLASGESLGGVTFAWFETETAQRLLLGNDTELTGVELQAAPGVSPEALRDGVAEVIPSGTEAVTGQELVDEANQSLEDDFLGAFRTFLLVFAGIALLVATFSIQNTFAIMVAQRTRETALMRAIGASRRQVLASVAAEAAVIGTVAAGLGLAHGLNALLDAAGAGVPTAGLALTIGVTVTGLVVGLIVTLVAALAPAIRSSRIAPIAALRDAEIDGAATSTVRAVAGVVVTTVGVLGLVFSTSIGDSPMRIAALGALCTFVGVVLLGPVVARLAAAAIGAPIAALRGTSGSLARRNAMRNPKRTASTASALMIGATVVALFASFGTSLKASLDDLVSESFGGDFVIYPEGFSGAGLSPALATELGELPDVDTVATLQFPAMLLDGREDEPLAVDFAALSTVAALDVVEGDLTHVDDHGAAVGRSYADSHGLTLGSTIEASFVDGSTETLTVEAIYANENLFGDNLVDARLWSRHTTTPEDAFVFLDLADGVPIDQARPEIESIAERYGDPLVEDADQYLASQGEQIDQMLNLVYGLLGLAVVIAVVGIANTLSLGIYERTREIGLLRAVGQSRRALRATVRWESVIVAIFGTVGGVGLGTLLCWGMMRAISASEGFGTFAVSADTLVVILVASVVAGVVAAIRPARRAARLDVLDAIATD